MAGPDLSLITNAPNLTDRINQQQAISSQLQAQQVDVRQKQNAYATQVMSAAAATGDPMQYAKGKQLLASQGIDVSNWSDDPVIGKQQAEAARMALISPLGMLNASINQEKAGAAVAGVNGTMATGLQPIGGAPSLTSAIPASSPPSGSAAGGFSASPLVTSGATTSLPQSGNAQPAPMQGAANSPPSLTAPIPSSAPVSATPPAPASTDEKYLGMNPEARNKALALDTEIYNKRPDVQAAVEAAKTQAGVTGTEVGDAKKTYDIASAGLPFALQRFSAMRGAAQNASSGLGVDQAGDGAAQQFANTALGKYMEPETGSGNQTLKQYSSQGVLGELGPQLAQSGVRGNKFLESIASNASGLDMSAAPDDKVTLINGLQDMYVQNLKKEADVLRKNGQPAMTDAQIDALVKSKTGSTAPSATIPATNGWAIKKVN